MHLALRVPAGAWFRTASETVYWCEGESMLIDGQLEHEACNPSDSPRTVLLVDFDLDPAEEALVLHERAAKRQCSSPVCGPPAS